MTDQHDVPHSVSSPTMEVLSSVAEERSDTVPCGNDVVCEESASLEEKVQPTRLSKPEKAKKQAAAVRAFVIEALHGGPFPAAAIKQAAKDAGFTDSQLRRATVALHVVRTKLPGMRTGWEWSLPVEDKADDNHDSPVSSDGYLNVDVA